MTITTTQDRCRAFIAQAERNRDSVPRGTHHRGEHATGAFGCDICEDLGLDRWGDGKLQVVPRRAR
jgi:hypothetical protein